MTAEPVSQDVIDLANAMHEADYAVRGGLQTFGDFAGAVVASDWLAERLAAARAEGLAAAWDEGRRAGYRTAYEVGANIFISEPVNPYLDTSAQ